MFPLLDGFGVSVDAHFRLIAVVAIVALFTAYGLLLWAIRSTRTQQRDLRCPEDGRTARVHFLFGPGRRPDVARCSLQGTPMTCSRRCLEAA